MEHGGVPNDGGAALASLLLLAVGIFLFYLFVRFVRKGFGRLGLSPGLVALMMWGSLVGSAISIPLFRFGDGWIGINVGGALVPLVVSLYLISQKRVPLSEALVGVALVTLAAYLVTDYEPGLGVVSPFPLYLIPPVLAAFVAAAAYWQERQDAAGLAYVGGTMGTIIGADLLRLPQILSGPALESGAVLAIGGAGVFDMVFLSGILAVGFQASQLLQAASSRIEQAFGNEPDRAIDQEFEIWLGTQRNKRAARPAPIRRSERPPARQLGRGPSKEWAPTERDRRPERRQPMRASERNTVKARAERQRERNRAAREARRARAKAVRDARRARERDRPSRRRPSEARAPRSEPSGPIDG